MKGCKDCGENDLDKFEVNKVDGEKIYYRSRCRSCYNAIKNERTREKARARRAQYLQDIQKL